MALRSKNVSIWIEKPFQHPSAEDPFAVYRRSKTYSVHSSMQYILPKHPLMVHEAYISSSPESPYRIVVRTPPHLYDLGIQVIIDGVEQGNFVSFSHFVSTTCRISGRRVGKTTLKEFEFSRLRIEDGYGNYKYDRKAHCKNGYLASFTKPSAFEPINFMLGKNAAGTIRINVYRVGKVKPGPQSQGGGDYDPCTVVDDIGHLKMRPGVESITTLGKRIDCMPTTSLYADFPDKYPFESFVFIYRPLANLAADNLLVVKPGKLRRIF